MIIMIFIIIRNLSRAGSPEKRYPVAGGDWLRAQRSSMQTEKVPEGQPSLQRHQTEARDKEPVQNRGIFLVGKKEIQHLLRVLLLMSMFICK